MTQEINRRTALKMAAVTSGALATPVSIASATEATNISKLSLGETYNSEEGEELSVVGGTALQSFVYHLQPDSPRVYGSDQDVFVFGEIESSYEEKPSNTQLEDFMIFVDGTLYPVSSDFGPVQYHQISSANDELAPAFLPKSGDVRLTQRTWGGVGAPVPNTSQHDSVGIAFTGEMEDSVIVWEFSEEVTQLMNSAPQFTVQNFTIPSPISPNSKATAKLVVRNSGDKGVFRSVLGDVNSSHPRSVERTIGADTTEVIPVPVHYPRVRGTPATAGAERAPDVTFRLSPAQNSQLTTTVTQEK